MSDQPKLRTALESLRSDDERSALERVGLRRADCESAEAAQASATLRRADAKLTAALHDVEIPAGLLDRLLTAVDAAPRGGENSVTPSEIAASTRPTGGVSRRRWWAVAAVSLAVVGLAAWASTWRAAPAIVPENLGFEALAWNERLADAWRETSEARPVPRPIDRQVRFAPRGWQLVDTPYDSQTVAYDLSRRQGAAVLFVLAPAAIPESILAVATPVPATGGWGAAAWRNGEHLYVLVVEQRRQKLDDFLRAGGSPIVSAPSVGRTSRGI